MNAGRVWSAVIVGVTGLWCCLISASVGAAEIKQHQRAPEGEMTLSLSADSVGVAQYFTLLISIDAAQELTVTFEFIDESIGPFKVVSRHPLGPLALADNRQRWQREYVLLAETPGELILPPMKIVLETLSMGQRTGCVLFNNCEGRPATQRLESTIVHEFVTEAVAVQVGSVLAADADTTKPKDIALPVELARPPVTGRLWLPGLAIAGVLALIALGVWWRRRLTTPATGPAVPARPDAHVIALNALDELPVPQDAGQMEAFHIRLADILRQYIDDRFTVRAPRLTTSELVQASDWQEGVIVVLKQCDQVKFARASASADLARRARQQVRQFIEQTAELA